jgi:hypothetical protein
LGRKRFSLHEIKMHIESQNIMHLTGAKLAYKDCGFKIIQGGQGASPPPENLGINGAIWCVLGPPESFLDQRKSVYFSIKMEMNSFVFVYFN